MNKETKIFQAEVKEFDDKELTVTHFISTERRDRGGDSMSADGMRIRGKPVVLMAHGFSNMGQEPIAKPVKISKGEFKGNKGIMAKTQFYNGEHLIPPDNTGKRLYEKAKDGFMPNWSIAYIPQKWEDSRGPKGEYYRDILEWELLEYSPVGVPMNPDAQCVDKCGNCQRQAWFKVLPDYREVEEKYGEIIRWKNPDGTWEEKAYPNEHACRLEDPDKYIRVRRENNKFGEGIHAIWGIQAGDKPIELQAIRFDKEKFTPAEAKAWLKDHDYKCKLFEPASEKCEKCGKPMVIKWDQDVSGDKCGDTCEASFTYEHDGKCEKEDPTLSDDMATKIEGAVLAALKKHIAPEMIDSKLKIAEDKMEARVKAIEDNIKSIQKTLAALPEAEKKKTDGEKINPPEPRKIMVVNTEEQRREASRQMSEVLSSTITKVVRESVKEQFDKLRGKVN